MLRVAGLALLLVTGACLVASWSRAAEQREPAPTAADVARAEGLIKEVFKKEYAKTKAADRVALATKMMKQASETTGDAAARFVLLREARDLFARAADPVMAMQAAGELATGFQVGAGEVRAAVADLLVTASLTQATARLSSEVLLDEADTARGAGEYGAEVTLLKAAETLARRGGSIPLGNAVRARLKEAETVQAEADKIRPQLATLKDKPTDPEANLAVGRFLCFFKQDWEAGPAHLARGADARLKDAAEKDGKAAAGTPTDRVAAADAWYDLAASADPAGKVALQLRAHHWYSAAAEGELTGITKARADRRLAELQPLVDARSDRARIWAIIRKAVSDNQLKRWPLLTGAGREPFEDVPPKGALLIGLYYTTFDNRGLPNVLQPIFLTATGEVKGKVYGVPNAGERVQVVKARRGYAVGGMYIRAGATLDGFRLTFMKIMENGLDTTDKYDGPYIGGLGGGDGTVGGDGNFIVGLHGRTGDKTKIDAICPVSMTSKPPAKK